MRDVKDTANYPHDFMVGFSPNAKIVRRSGTQFILHLIQMTLGVNSKSEHPQEAMKFIGWYIEEGMDYGAFLMREFRHGQKYDADKVVSLYLVTGRSCLRRRVQKMYIWQEVMFHP